MSFTSGARSRTGVGGIRLLPVPRLGLVGRFTVMLALLASACQPARTEPALPPGPPVVTVTLTEYRFEYDPNIPPGRVVFRFVNAGTVRHRPALIPLPESIPPIEEQLHGDQRVVTVPFAGIRGRDPGETGTFAVDLTADVRYALICFARDPNGESHALKGMASEFRPSQQGAPSLE
ncbi:MAG: hypothetical protein M3O70_03220 [Actinomycetota bacterium]|nr:hypothetical protein [Actinomycetota bacterium]